MNETSRENPTSPHVSSVSDHVPWLDGLRGLAALWVFVAHVQILSGVRYIPVLAWGGLAVDLFMMLSGFLMAHHYLLRERQEPWDQPSTWGRFWTRRFFRIAPLYYAVLVIALLLGPWLGAQREAIAAAWPSTATSPQRYLDQGASNFIAHLSFVFGALPDYAFRTALPDWSIGLEMQFYLVFPLLMMAIARFGGVATSLVLVLLCAWAQWRWAGWFQRFEMPAFLPMKLYVFLAGMGIALGRARGRLGWPLLLSLGVCAVAAAVERTSEAWARVPLVIGLYYLMDDGSLPGRARVTRAVAAVRRWMSAPLSRFCGDTAYGFYLVHLLLLLPVAGWLARQPAYVASPAGLRFAVCFVVVGVAAYALAWAVYRWIEQPGIQLGKALLRRKPVAVA